MPDFNPDEFLAQPQAAAPQADSAEPNAAPEAAGSGFDPDAFITDLNEQQYGTPKQQAIAGIEGAAKGLVGPLAPLLEKKMHLATPAEMKARAETNPWTHGIGEATTLVGGALAGTGVGGLMGKAGEAAEIASGMGKVGETASLGAKVGSEAVKQAAEMAVLQSSDETAKMIMNDQPTSAQTALANVGLAAAIGGAGGAFMTGAVNPLWKATAGPKVEQLLGMVKNHLNGGSRLILPEEMEAAAKTLGVELDPVQRASVSADDKARNIVSDLRRAEHPEVLGSIENLHNNISNSVMDSLGVTVDGVKEYSDNEAGHVLSETFQNEVKQKMDPAKAAMEARDAEAAPLRVSDESRLDHAGKIIEQGIRDVGTDSPIYPLYTQAADRLLAKNTVGEVDALKSEIFNDMKKARRAGDDNTLHALTKIRQSLGDFQQQQIEKAAMEADRVAAAQAKVIGQPRVNVGELESAKPAADELIARRAAQNKTYAQAAGIMDQLMDHLGLGDFRGTKGLLSKITEKLSPEELMRKFNIKGNADLIPFLRQYFPETLNKVLENERKQMLKPAILSAAKKGENPVDVKKLAEIIQKNLSGKKEYVMSVLPADALKKVEAGRVLANAIPTPRDSGTPAGLAKLFAKMPASAVSAISWAMGHGAIGGYMAGEMAQKLGKDAPEAIKLGYLRFLSSDQPVKAEGFRAMIDFLHNTYKGESLLSKATSNVLKPGFQVFTDAQMPTTAEIARLDKLVAKNQNEPNKFIDDQKNSQIGHYLPQHQQALTEASAQALQYLQQLKPHPYKPGPLDREIPPSPMQEARYNRALMIAQQPMVVLQHIKDGTLQLSDIQDFKAMYPAVYQRTAQKLTNEMISRHADEAPIPYKTRVGISLFLGQPLDSSMLPASIMAAQPMPKAPTPQQNQGKTKKGTTNLGKSNKSYKTPGQAAESDRSDRE